MFKTKGVPESEFNMWRTLFAVAHADDIVTNEEVRHIAEILEDNNFSDAQRKILNDDIIAPKDIGEMYSKITEKKHQAKFFALARRMVHADGDFGKAEQGAMLEILTRHIKEVDLDDLVGLIEMELEEDGAPREEDGKKSFFYSFRERFLKERFGE